MFRSLLKVTWLALLLSPLCALAFEAVDVLTPAENGIYPAYPGAGIRPYEFWAQFGMMYDSNILRRTTGDNHELVSRLGVGGRWDQRVVGRQSVHLEGRLDGYVYDRFSDLDNIAYAGLGEWRFEVGNDLAGTVGVSRRKFQASLSEIQRAAHDPITETVVNTGARYALGPHLGVRGGASFIEYNRPSRSFSNTRTVVGTGGIDYVTSLGNVIGVEASQGHGDAPVDESVDPLHIFVSNGYRQRDVGVVTAWTIGTFVRVAGRVGRTVRQYTALPGRDFNGPTWNLVMQWTPTAKTVLVLESSKRVTSIIDIGASHIVAKEVGFGPGWAPTAKLNFQARLFRQHQVFEGDPNAALGVSPLRQEFIRGYRLGSYWEYTRQVHFTFALDHGERESNILGRNYTYNAATGNVKYFF